MSRDRSRPGGPRLPILVLAAAVLLALGGLGWLLRSRPGGSAAQAPRAPDRGRAGDFAAEQPGVTSARMTGALEGVVEDPAGAPVANAAITLSAPADDAGVAGPRRFGVRLPIDEARSDASGRFRFAAVPVGRYEVTGAARGFGAAAAGPVDVSAGAVARVTLRLARAGHVLRGRVVDSAGGLIPGARVWARLTGGAAGTPMRGLVAAELDGKGGYQLTLRAGDHAITALADGYAPASEAVRLFADAQKDLRLDPESSLAGVVTDGDGRQPVAGAEVVAAAPGALDVTMAARALTDEAGRFTIRGLPAGTYLVRATKGRRAGERRVRLAVGDLERQVEIALDAGFVVRGRVTRSDGAAVADATLIAGGGASIVQRNGALATTSSASDGAFALEGLFPGSYQLITRAPGFAGKREGIRIIDRDLEVNVVLEAAGTVVGRVVDEAGGPVVGARVASAVQQGSGAGWSAAYQTTLSDEAGNFELRGLVGPVSLRAEHPGAGAATHGPETVAPGSRREVVLKLSGRAAIAGTVRDSHGQPAPGVTVSVRFDNAPRPWFLAEAQTDKEGRYAASGIPTGRVFVSAYRRSGPAAQMRPMQRTQERTVEMPAAGRVDGVDLVLPAPAGALGGQVLLPDGQPAVGAVVKATQGPRHHAFAAAHRASVGPDGSFSLEDVDAVPYTVWAGHPDHAEAEVRGIVPGTSQIVLRLKPAAAIAGQVTTREGRPVPDFDLLVAPVMATRVLAPGGPPAPRPTDLPSLPVHDVGGRFEAGPLTAGEYQVTVRSPTGATASERVALGEGERRSDLRLVVGAAAAVRGRVLDEETGQPLAGVSVAAILGTSSAGEAVTGPDGGFTLDGLAPGSELRLMFRGPGTHLPDRENFKPPPGQSAADFGTIRLLRGSWGARSSAAALALGFEHARQAGAVVITAVHAGSPAARAGLHAGDLWVALGGRPVAEIGYDGRLYLLTSAAAEIELTVEARGAGARKVVLPRPAAVQN